MKRIINKDTGLFIRDDFTFDEETEIGLDVEPSQGLYKPKWDFENETWIEGGVKPEPIITIEELKQQLADTDYKIIKCYEYQMAGKELPYDIVELSEERDKIRELINEIEVRLKSPIPYPQDNNRYVWNKESVAIIIRGT